MIEIKIKIPDWAAEYLLLTEGDTIEYNMIPFGKHQKALRLLERSIYSITDNYENYLKWKKIIDEITQIQNESTKSSYSLRNTELDLSKLKNLSCKYSLGDISNILQDLEGQLKKYKRELQEKVEKIEKLRNKLPKFLRTGAGWWKYRNNSYWKQYH